MVCYFRDTPVYSGTLNFPPFFYTATHLIFPAFSRAIPDAKAGIPIGWFSRGGQTRVITKVLDHDFGASAKLTPYGIFLPEQDELYLYFTTSCITSDFIVDCLTDCWQTIQQRFSQVTTLLINQDNGGENHSRLSYFRSS